VGETVALQLDEALYVRYATSNPVVKISTSISKRIFEAAAAALVQSYELGLLALYVTLTLPI